MNPRQMAQQLKHLLERVTWTAGAGDAVFGTTQRVAVFAGVPSEEQVPTATPWALVGILDSQADAEDPDLLEQRFAVVIGAEVTGDRFGEHALTGGAVANIGRSAGRGVSELSARVRAAVGKLSGFDGVRLQLGEAASQAPRTIGPGRQLVVEEMQLVALCTAQPHYTAPQHLRYEFDRWKWNGAACSARFDFYRYRLVRKQGVNAPTSPSDGTTVYTGTEPQFVGAQQSGQSYTIFADYNSRGAASVEGSSSRETGATRTP